VALLTGDRDGVVDETRRVGKLLEDAAVPVRTCIVPGLGHELAVTRPGTPYRRLVAWLLGGRPRTRRR
jgi:acetyl esterase/lipase